LNSLETLEKKGDRMPQTIKIEKTLNSKEFTKGSFEKPDYVWIFWFTVLTFVALSISIIDPTSSAGRIYTTIGLFSLILIGLAFVAMRFAKKLPFAFVGVGGGNYAIGVAGGFAVSLLLVGSQLFQLQSFLSPLSIPTLTFLGMGAIGGLFMLSLYISEMEETIRASILSPTMSNAVIQFGLPIVAILMGSLVYFVLSLQIIGLIMIAFGLILFFQKQFTKIYTSPKIARLAGIIFAGITFAGLHYLAYSANYTMMFSAFIFAVVIDLINGAIGNTIAGRIAHSVNNGTLAAVAMGQPAFLGLIVGASHAGILYFVRKSEVKPA